MSEIEKKTMPDGRTLRILRFVSPEEEVPERVVRYVIGSLGFDSYNRYIQPQAYWRSYYREAFDGRLAGVRDHLYLAEVDGVFAARLWFAYSRKSGFGNFGNVFTEPAFRRLGLMNELMAPCMADFEAAQDARILCCASGSRFAVASYLKHGFRLTYGGETGPLERTRCPGEDFFSIEREVFADTRLASTRPGNPDDQFIADKFIAHTEPVLSRLGARRGPAAAVPDFRTARIEAEIGNGALLAACNAAGTVTGYCFALASGGAGQIEKTGSEAIDWMAAMGKFTDESKAAIRRNPARSLDWFRWRAWSVNRVYAEYVAEAKRTAPDANVLYGNNYPWPNYFAHMVWPQWRWQDVIELDVQYVCGFEKTLGNNEEMIDILEAAESIGKRYSKPIWGREVYYQPRYPGEVAALQNWAMVAHGMDVALDFAWKPYADYKREIFKTGTNSWEKKESPPMWFMIDTDGTRLPGYYAAKRSGAEVADFHARVDARRLRRIQGETALYWSTETSAKIMFDTFDRPYESLLARARSDITAGLRYRGARVEFFDDDMLGELTPEKFPVCVVPPAPVVSDAALAKLRAYAERGGRLVIFAPFNTLDVNLRAKGDAGGAAGWKGDVRLVGDFPVRYNPCPHDSESYARWFDDFVRDAGIPRSAWWENDAPYETGEENLGPGEGRPVVEVVVRRHAATGCRYAFVLNKGGAGAGRLSGPDFSGAKLVDSFTGEEVEPHFALPAFGYRALEIWLRRK